MDAMNRAFTPINRAYAAQSRAAAVSPPPTSDSGLAHQGRGNAALMLADRIAAQSRAVLAREDVTPEMEPHSPSLTDEESGEDFGENEDVTDEMEPFDPTIESAFRRRVTVTGDEGSVTITAEEGETILGVIEDEHGNVEVEVEDTADVLLTAPQPRVRATITGNEDEITITADEGEVLDWSESDDGDVMVHVDDA